MIVDYDADSVVYQIAYSNDGNFIEDAIAEMDFYIEGIHKLLNPAPGEFNIWLGHDESIRKLVYPDYKDKRKPRPDHWQALRDHLDSYQEVRYAPLGYEADDALAVRARNFRELGVPEEDYLIVSIDKDLNTVPGYHYNPVEDITYYVSEYDAFFWLMCQMIMGDTPDNIKGVHGLGKKWCIENLDYDTNSEVDKDFLVRKVKRAYIDFFNQDWRLAKQFYDKNLFLLGLGLKGPTVNVVLNYIESLGVTNERK